MRAITHTCSSSLQITVELAAFSSSYNTNTHKTQTAATADRTWDLERVAENQNVQIQFRVFTLRPISTFPISCTLNTYGEGSHCHAPLMTLHYGKLIRQDTSKERDLGVSFMDSPVHNWRFMWKLYLWEQFSKQCLGENSTSTSPLALFREGKCHANGWSLVLSPWTVPLKGCPANHLICQGNGHLCSVLQRLRDGGEDWHCVIPLHSTSFKHLSHDLGISKKGKAAPITQHFKPYVVKFSINPRE